MVLVKGKWCRLFNGFFFQAEDGIRDAQESRGLGDVYKGQSLRGRLKVGRQVLALKIEVRVLAPQPFSPFGKATVSYTHLTLPTIYSV